MHRMGSSDSSKGKTFFKKRTHRPWNMVFLETPLEENATAHLKDSPSADAIDNKSEEHLLEILAEKTKECHEIEVQLNEREDKRLSIGGFLHPSSILTQHHTEEKANITRHLMNELKHKEQEILSLAHDLKVSKALEQVEKLEISRKKEEEARKSAENKALFAIQEAKAAAEQAYKLEIECEKEREYRMKVEKTKKTLEEKHQSILQEVVNKEHMLIKTKEALEEAVALGQRLKAEAEDKIKKIVQGMSEQIEKHKSLLVESNKQAFEKRATTERELYKKIQEIEIKANERIEKIEIEAESRIQEMQKQIQHQANAKNFIQLLGQKNIELLRQAEMAKKEMEAKLETFKNNARDERTKFEGKIHDLLAEINQHEQQKIIFEKDKNLIEQNLLHASNTIKIMKTIIENEKNLRKILERKLKENPILIDEQKRKLAENKVLELTQNIGNLEIEKSKLEEYLANTKEEVNQAQILLASEKTLRASLETQLKEALEKICNLEALKQKEVDEKHLTEQKIAILLNQKEYLEQEKRQNEEKLKTLLERTQELEVMMESEKYLRQEAERLKMLEEQARKVAQDKMTHAIEQANRTVLNALNNLMTTGASSEHI